ncbi:MAG: aminotransferase [Gammaproteobacteria bacterium]|nr:aminotransferase [Gammaproteobacteria bacterium]
MKIIRKSEKLTNVCYDIRGPVLDEAYTLEAEGHRILKLNIGNPAPFGLDAPEEILQDVIYNLTDAQGYSDSKGLFSARKAIMQDCQQENIKDVQIEDIFLGNGVSELIMMALQGLLNNKDEVLVPVPDYPLWTAAVTLAGGIPIHYKCDESQGWEPDLDDIKARITKRTRAIVVINPNNPTGSVYKKETLEGIIEIARQYNLIIYADEIYDKIIYDEAVHHPIGSLADDVLTVTMNGLSKTHRVAGFRAGWMILSGAKDTARDYIDGLNILASMRLCANVPGQYAIQTALGGYQSINDFTRPGGRLHDQREIAWSMLNNIDGITCTKPMGALYLFPKIDTKRFQITNDEQFALDFLREEKILVVQGTGFNWSEPDHFRIVFLPRREDLIYAIDKLANFLSDYHQ